MPHGSSTVELSRYFRISSRSHHGLLFVAELARQELRPHASPVSIRSVARTIGISEKYLEELVGSLRQVGIVRGLRGRGGGYRLTKPAASITVGEIVRALEGPVVLAACQDSSVRTECPHAAQCATKHFFGRLKRAIDGELEGMTVGDLIAYASPSV